MKNHWPLLCVIAFSLGSMQAQERAKCKSHVEYIDVPTQATTELGMKPSMVTTKGMFQGQGTRPSSINKFGAVAGWYWDGGGTLHGFLRTPGGAYVILDAPGAGVASGQGTAPCCINAAGQIAGTEIVPIPGDPYGVYYRGFVRALDGTYTVFDLPWSGTSAGEGPIMTAFTERGDVAGEYFGPDLALHGFVRNADGTFERFDAPDAGRGEGWNYYFGTYVAAMNDRGFVAGTSAFRGGSEGYERSSDAGFKTLKAPGAVFTEGQSINLAGSAVGDYVGDDVVSHGFLGSANGDMTSFDVPAAGKAQLPHAFYMAGTYPTSINRVGEIAGSYIDADAVSHAFLRTRHGGIVGLTIPEASTTMISPFVPAGTMALQVSDRGAVVGYYTDANDVDHGFVWWP